MLLSDFSGWKGLLNHLLNIQFGWEEAKKFYTIILNLQDIIQNICSKASKIVQSWNNTGQLSDVCIILYTNMIYK